MFEPGISPPSRRFQFQPPSEVESLAANLTRREHEVLALLAKGMSNPEIAGQLCISRATVKVHISNILSKLGVANRAEAISLAIQNKLVH